MPGPDRSRYSRSTRESLDMGRRRPWTCDLIFSVIYVRVSARELLQACSGATIPEKDKTRRQARALARALNKMRRRGLYSGPDHLKHLVIAHEYARLLARRLPTIHSNNPFAEGLRAEGMRIVHAIAQTITDHLEAISVDGSDADLSRLSLSLVERRQPNLFANIVWNRGTTWPAGMAEKVRGQSRKIRPGVFKVTSI
jgi:hypothetical protein